jgi:predicted RNase H-like nuclease (RuvC/YqgF family)
MMIRKITKADYELLKNESTNLKFKFAVETIEKIEDYFSANCYSYKDKQQIDWFIQMFKNKIENLEKRLEEGKNQHEKSDDTLPT